MRIIVTGGAGGIGRELVRALSEAGHQLLSCDLAHRDAPSIPPEWEAGAVTYCRLDVADAAQVAALFAWASGNGGEASSRIDAVIHCAGRGVFKPFLELTAADWRDMLEANAIGAFLVSHAAAQVMSRTGGGRMVHFGSIAGAQPLDGSAAYGASKAALGMLCQSMNRELSGAGIRTTLLTLGAVYTPIWESRPEFSAADMLSVADVAAVVRDIVEAPLQRRIDEVTLLPPKGTL